MSARRRSEREPLVQVGSYVRRLQRERAHTEQRVIIADLHAERPLVLLKMIEPVTFESQPYRKRLVSVSCLCGDPIVVIELQDALSQGLFAFG